MILVSRKLIINNIVFVVFIILSMFTLTSCYQNTNGETINKADDSITEVADTSNNASNGKVAKNNEIVNYNMDELIKALKEAVNNDIWYEGQYSSYSEFESIKSEIEVYLNPNEPDEINIYFKKPISFFRGKEKLFVIEIWKDKHGYMTDSLNYYVADTPIEIEERLKERGFTDLFQKIEIEFGEVTQPVFPPMTDERKRIIDDIEKAVIHNLKYNPENKGTFKIFIRNFNDNSKTTPVVVQYPDGIVYVANVEVGFNKENSYLRIYKPMKPGVSYPGGSVSEYTANQYKKVSFEREFEL